MAQINIAGTLHNTEEIQGDALNSHVVAHADEILDSTQEKKQSEVNADVQTELGDRYTKAETYSKSQVDNLITTPDVQYVTVATYSALPPTGEADTIYRVASWDGSAVDDGKYSEYAWNGSAYQLLAVRSGSLDGVYDISANNLTEGQPTQYADLAAALGTDGANVPSGVHAGGMSVRFINSSTGKYEQWRLMAASWSTNVSDWQGVDEEPTAGSQNLVTSGGVKKEVSRLQQKVDGDFVCDEMQTFITSSGIYSNGAYDKSYIIPVLAGDVVVLSANVDSAYALYSLVSMYPEIGSTADFLPGTTRTQYRINGKTFTIPEKCYLVVTDGHSSASDLCKDIVINGSSIKAIGINDVNERVDEVNERVDEVNERVDEVNERIDEISEGDDGIRLVIGDLGDYDVAGSFSLKSYLKTGVHYNIYFESFDTTDIVGENMGKYFFRVGLRAEGTSDYLYYALHQGLGVNYSGKTVYDVFIEEGYDNVLIQCRGRNIVIVIYEAKKNLSSPVINEINELDSLSRPLISNAVEIRSISWDINMTIIPADRTYLVFPVKQGDVVKIQGNSSVQAVHRKFVLCKNNPKVGETISYMDGESYITYDIETKTEKIVPENGFLFVNVTNTNDILGYKEFLSWLQINNDIYVPTIKELVEKLQEGGGVTDSELDPTSANPVQNKTLTPKIIANKMCSDHGMFDLESDWWIKEKYLEDTYYVNGREKVVLENADGFYYSVDRKDRVTTQPSGSPLPTLPNITSGSYVESEMSEFPELPDSAGSSISYYYYDSKKERYTGFIIKRSNCFISRTKNNGKFKIAIISDTHGSGAYTWDNILRTLPYTCYRSIAVFNKIASYCDCAFHGGDISCDYGTSRIRQLQYMYEIIRLFSFNKPFFITKGNHDENYNEYVEADMLNLDWVHNTYYKRNFSTFTSVTEDTWDGSPLFIKRRELISDKEFRNSVQHWLSPSGSTWGNGAYYFYDMNNVKLRIIVANSFPVKDDYSNSEDEEYLWLAQTALNLSAKEIPSDWKVIMLRHIQSTSITDLTDCINAFRNGNSWTYKGTTVDFGAINGGGITFIAHIHGHNHSNCFSNGEGYFDIGEDWSPVPLKNLGEASYYGISVWSIDFNNGKVYEDTIDGHTWCYNYNTNKLEIAVGESIAAAESDLERPVTASSSDPSIASCEGRVVTAISPGNTIITVSGGAKSLEYPITVVSNYDPN